MQVKFLFTLDEYVSTPFHERALVSKCALDGSGVIYYVKTSNGGAWFPEEQLKSLPTSEIGRVLQARCSTAFKFAAVTP